MNSWSHFAVYDSPTDFPGCFVVREFLIAGEPRHPIPVDPPIAVVATLQEARAALPTGLGLCRFARLPDDDLRLVEVWL